MYVLCMLYSLRMNVFVYVNTYTYMYMPTSKLIHMDLPPFVQWLGCIPYLSDHNLIPTLWKKAFSWFIFTKSVNLHEGSVQEMIWEIGS